MTEIHIGPTIRATIAWGCSLNMIVSSTVTAKEGWNVQSVALMSTPRILGIIAMFIHGIGYVCGGLVGSVGLTTMSQIRRALLILAVPFVLVGCNGDRVEELESQVADLESQLEDVRSKLSNAEAEVDSLRSAVDDLDNAVGEFEYTDWRIVLSNVQSAASDVESAASNVESSIADTVNAAQ